MVYTNGTFLLVIDSGAIEIWFITLQKVPRVHELQGFVSKKKRVLSLPWEKCVLSTLEDVCYNGKYPIEFLEKAITRCPKMDPLQYDRLSWSSSSTQ
jgi:hypothetical protein